MLMTERDVDLRGADFEVDVDGVGFAAALVPARAMVAEVGDRVGWLAPGTMPAAFATLAGLREELARLEVAMVAHFERLGSFAHAGARSTTSWLERNTGRSAWSALLVSRAVAAVRHPVVRDELERGSSSIEQVAAVAALVGLVEKDECDGAALVEALSQPSVRDTRRAVARVVAAADERAGRRASTQRSLRESETDHGTKVTRLELEPDAHATFLSAVSLLAEEARRSGAAKEDLACLRADAVVEMARRILYGTSSPSGSVVNGRGKPEVLVIVDHQTLLGQVSALGVARLSDGTPISGETARRIACDANIIPAVLNGRGETLDLGRAKRLASAAQRTSLRARWRCCAFLDCTMPIAWTRAHHTDPWNDGGRTDDRLLVPLCERHHHLVHEGGWTIRATDEGGYVIARPDGTHHATVGPNGVAP